MRYKFGRKMSNQFKTIMYEEDGRDYFEVTGSPADIKMGLSRSSLKPLS